MASMYEQGQHPAVAFGPVLPADFSRLGAVKRVNQPWSLNGLDFDRPFLGETRKKSGKSICGVTP